MLNIDLNFYSCLNYRNVSILWDSDNVLPTTMSTTFSIFLTGFLTLKLWDTYIFLLLLKEMNEKSINIKFYYKIFILICSLLSQERLDFRPSTSVFFSFLLKFNRSHSIWKNNDLLKWKFSGLNSNIIIVIILFTSWKCLVLSRQICFLEHEEFHKGLNKNYKQYLISKMYADG